MVGVSIHRPGTVVRPGRIDAAPVGGSGRLTVVEDGLSDFARLVAPVRERLAASRWVLNCRDEYLCFPEDWYREFDAATGELTDPRVAATGALVLARHESWKYVEGEYLEVLADTLVDEWWDFFAVESDVGDLEAWVSEFWAAKESGGLEAFISSRASFFVAGIDAVRWDFFSSDPAAITAIQTHAEGLPGFVVRRTTLKQHVRTFYGGS